MFTAGEIVGLAEWIIELQIFDLCVHLLKES